MHMVNGAILERWNELTDEQVVAQVLNGQTALFEVLMRRHNERVYRAARAIVRDDVEAEDVMQQAYVNAYAHLAQFSGKAQFSTWLLRITANEALARVRRHRAYEVFDEEQTNVENFSLQQNTRDPERSAVAAELRHLLETVIDGLPDGAREVFVLRDVEGLSTEETAGALNVSEDVVKTRLSRARAALRREIVERTGAAAADVFGFFQPRCDRLVASVMSRIS
jgi:RNA polymerase sigma-70 factor (ECF subfamily)